MLPGRIRDIQGLAGTAPVRRPGLGTPSLGSQPVFVKPRTWDANSTRTELESRSDAVRCYREPFNNVRR
ncbi:uncharacterized protein MYCGRDRAFT_103496 [Zymoseptoria tritici IPO323]|uniref:Uncharacterized protein n=1 Tax=Zymoseptoria tritici (strain CBS 115943 / IPO323) TaxID=336722 RepID=F9X4V2_ZYMTI|nr:uncharacterized protein MYCGRDRAFT_103496 [Zymoseptoria tritici IPO323]EGP90177.1 hypothetical protein MYCGRDRAFT_103496 [Zymoseptoria tritici IPO323]